MIPPVAEFYRTLDDQKERFLESLEACSAEQLAYQQTPDAWTIVQVGHHVAIAEQRVADSIKKHRGMRSGKRGLRFKVGNALLWVIFKTGLRVKNPVPAAAPDPDVDLAKLLEIWGQARVDLKAVLSELKERGLQYAAFQHPIGGPFNVEESLEFLVAHLEHHLRQLQRIQQDPSFPDRP